MNAALAAWEFGISQNEFGFTIRNLFPAVQVGFGRLTGLFFKVSVENRLGIKAAFISQADQGDMAVIRICS